MIDADGQEGSPSKKQSLSVTAFLFVTIGMIVLAIPLAWCFDDGDFLWLLAALVFYLS